jgi:thioredoxin reductase
VVRTQHRQSAGNELAIKKKKNFLNLQLNVTSKNGSIECDCLTAKVKAHTNRVIVAAGNNSSMPRVKKRAHGMGSNLIYFLIDGSLIIVDAKQKLN